MAYTDWAARFGNMLIYSPSATDKAAYTEQVLARKFADKWKQYVVRRRNKVADTEEMETERGDEEEGNLLDFLIARSWLKSLLFHTSSVSIRAETAILVEELSRGSAHR